MDSASSWSCVTMIVVVPALRWMRFSSICMSSLSALSSAANGSSSSRIDGCTASARDCYTLLLPTRQLPRITVGEATHLHEVQHGGHPRLLIPAAQTPDRFQS